MPYAKGLVLLNVLYYDTYMEANEDYFMIDIIRTNVINIY